jgi:hypothetical protein
MSESSGGRSAWTIAEWDQWGGRGTSPTDLPPIAVAALADALASAGQRPIVVVEDLRAELRERLANDEINSSDAALEESGLVRLEAEISGEAVPKDKCVKCRREPRAARMVSCGHVTLCAGCAAQATAHAGGSDTRRAAKLARLVCPVCRGFEREADSTPSSMFAIIDANQSGSIEAHELMAHLLVAGQEPEAISELFRGLDTDQDGVISMDEWLTGFQRFLNLTAHATDIDATVVAGDPADSDAPTAPDRAGV